MIEFAWPWLLTLIPLPVIVYLLPKRSQTTASALRMPVVFNDGESSTSLGETNKTNLLFLSLIWVLLIISSARPQWLGEAINIPTQGREMMIAVDLSGSMQVEDMVINGSSVNRLDMLKEVLGEFIERRNGDRLGLILFGDDAYMQTPMTFDRNTVKQMLDEAVLGLVGKQTAIGDAIGLAVKRFDEKSKSNRVLVLLTDGQNTAGKLTPEQALELAVAKDITIYTIGIGADEMVQRSFFGTRKVNPSAELDEESLQNIATQTNGKYFRARDSKAMAEIYELLDQLEPIDQDQQQMRPLTALFYWPLGIAALISLMLIIIKSRIFALPMKGAKNG